MVPSPSAARSLFLMLAVAAATTLAADKPIPDFLKICKQNDPDLNTCLMNSIKGLQPRLAKGIPEMNVPSLEPLELKEMVLTDKGNFRITGSNIKCFGTSKFILSKLRYNKKNGVNTFHLEFPKGLRVEGKYSVKGIVVLLPVLGKGPFHLNITDPSADVTLHQSYVTRNNVEYLDFPSQKVKIVIPGGSVRLDNLFRGDIFLGNIVNSAVNANLNQSLRDFKPSVEKALESNLLEIARGVVKSFPAKDLFPKS